MPQATNPIPLKTISPRIIVKSGEPKNPITCTECLRRIPEKGYLRSLASTRITNSETRTARHMENEGPNQYHGRRSIFFPRDGRPPHIRQPPCGWNICAPSPRSNRFTAPGPADLTRCRPLPMHDPETKSTPSDQRGSDGALRFPERIRPWSPRGWTALHTTATSHRCTPRPPAYRHDASLRPPGRSEGPIPSR